jgi:hypothetical protein
VKKAEAEKVEAEKRANDPVEVRDRVLEGLKGCAMGTHGGLHGGFRS